MIINLSNYEFVKMEAIHSNGFYKLKIEKMFVDENEFITSFPFTTLYYIINAGRKSQKRLDILNQFIKNHSEEILELWKETKNQDIIKLFKEV